MIDLDKYLNQTVDFRLNDMELHIKQPTALQTMRIQKLENEMTEDNLLDSKCEMTHIMLNNNLEGIEITMDEVKEIPFKVQTLISQKIAEMKLEVESDPN